MAGRGFIHPVSGPHVGRPMIHQLMGPHISFGGFGDTDEGPMQRARPGLPDHIRPQHDHKQKPGVVDPGLNPNPITGPEAFGLYAQGIDPKQMGVDKSLKPGRAFRNLGVGGASFMGAGGGGAGFGGLLGGGGGDLAQLFQLLSQLMGQQDQRRQPIAGGIQ